MKTKLIITIAAFAVAFFAEAEFTSAQAPPNMVWIYPGTFTMGSPMTEVDRDTDEGPQTQVTLTQGFYLGKYEVTQGEYLAVMGRNPSSFSAAHGYGTDLNRPVETVSWFNATNYCGKLTTREQQAGRLQSGWAYRLPTEAEWEYSCRAGTATAFHYGQSLRSGMENFSGHYEYDASIGTIYNPNGIYLGQTTPVGSYVPNAWGLNDMHGNVKEWCQDWWPGSFLPQGIDPQGPSSEVNSTGRVVRGGSWFYIGALCRSAVRNSRDPLYGYSLLGFRVVLSPITPQWRQVFETAKSPPTYSDCPDKQLGKENLIVVTHGYILPGIKPEESTRWITDMTNQITQYLLVNHMDNWQVHAHRWWEKAQLSGIDAFAFGSLLDNAEKEGGNLGNCIGHQVWKHIHLIAHSAGAALIETASAKIKPTPSTTTVIHTTFLDAYVGIKYGGRERYGKRADWSDSYFSRDNEIGHWYTEGPLNHAYNVDVTWLDTNKKQFDSFGYSPLYNVQPCYETITSHGWPTLFYSNTIPPITPLPHYDGFGFPLSKEGGNWDYAISAYSQPGNGASYGTVIKLGTPDPPCFVQKQPDFKSFPNLKLAAFPNMKSITGIIQNNGFGLGIASSTAPQPTPNLRAKDAPAQSTSSAWIAFFVTPTNAVNFISLETVFTSDAGAEGLLSVYWDTNTIGQIDEQVVFSGLQQYSFMFPRAESNSLHVLGFRLDAFTDTASSVVVTNVAVGFAGVSEPFTLRPTTNISNGLRVLEFAGQSGFDYNVDASTNLVDWNTIAVLVNTNGTVRFVDRESTNFIQRFYRAVAP